MKSKALVDRAIQKVVDIPRGKIFSLDDLMKGEPEWEENYRFHAGAGKAFFNRVEAKYIVDVEIVRDRNNSDLMYRKL